MTNPKYKLIEAFRDGFDSDIDPNKLFVVRYDKLPNIYTALINCDSKDLLLMLQNDYQISDANILKLDEESKKGKPTSIKKESSQFILELKNELFIEYTDYKVKFFYANPLDKALIMEIAGKLKKKKPKNDYKNRFYMVARSRRTEYGLDLQHFKITKDAIEIKELYNDDFWPVHEQISFFLNEKKKNGIIMLHGKYGTGKSTYIRYLMQNHAKRFIFLPNHMVSALSSPEFMPFMTNYSDSILVLEDCEDLLRPRTNNNRNEALVNLLNLGDGLLSDAMSIKLICTFNADLKNIEPAILRKGRLAARYEFDALTIPKAKILAEKIGVELPINTPLTLAELFNANKQNFGEIEGKSVGFGVPK